MTALAPVHVRLLLVGLVALATNVPTSTVSADSLVYMPPAHSDATEPGNGLPGVGQHIVFLAGDHEYRSEEALPALARILSARYGFKCTVLFTVDPQSGEIDPAANNLPGTEALASADLAVFGMRFKDLPDDQMRPIDEYLQRGGPVIGLRTSTHAFKIASGSKYEKYDYRYKGDDFSLGFGRQVLGETWAGHYGKNHVLSTRLTLTDSGKSHPIMRGVIRPWAQSGGYWAEPMDNSQVLALAQPLADMTEDALPAPDKLPCPGAWVRTYQSGSGHLGRVFTTTNGASEDILNDDFRRMVLNAALWAVGSEDAIKPNGPIEFVGPYQPTTFRFNGHRKNVRPSDLKKLDSPILPDNQSRVSANRPNVLFIMSDDHTWQAVGAYGSPLAALNPTPTIDRLAAEGMRFDSVVCTNSICTPSRACIMTGQYSHVNGVLTLAGRLPKERQHLAREMSAAGYQTAVIGKWHLKDRPDAFDYYKVVPGQGKYFDPEFFETGSNEKLTMSGHSTDCITDSALEWFETKRKPDQPFFLKLHFKAPHDYFENAPRYDSYLADVSIPEPETLWNRGEGSIATRGVDGELERVLATSIGRRNWRRSYAADFKVDESLSDEDAKRAAYNIYLKKYLRCVKGVDDNIARVIEYLEANDLLDNTVIMYTGDQGFFLGEHDMQDKRWAYEPCLRMPLIVRYPQAIRAGAVSDAIVENVDFPVTMLDFAGVERPEYMQGRSFRSVLETGKEPQGWKREAFYQYWMHMAHHDVPSHIAMRTKRHKLILFHGTSGGATYSKRSVGQTPPAWELYDLKVDPTESNNLADDAEHAELLQRLKKQFARLRTRVRSDDFTGIKESKKRDIAKQVSATIDRFWDLPGEGNEESKAISHAYLEAFGKPDHGGPALAKE